MGTFEQIAISGVLSLVVYALILAAVYKLFQIGTELSEIKDLLQDIKRNTQEVSPSTLSAAQSPESLAHAVSSESYPPAPVTPVPTT